jgi:Gram-negative bacterial TonB protein C-terminal
MFAATIVLAVSTVGLAAAAGQDPGGQGAESRSAWPHNQGRLFATPSKEAWGLVQARLKELGLPAAKTDRENQLLLSKWASFGDGRFKWLPQPATSQQYAPDRVQFEVFVSPFVEPARVYVGSVTELRVKGRTARSLLYNNRALNQALLGEIVKALGQQGYEIPSSRKERDQLAASIRKGRADDCPQRIESCREPSRELREPQKLPLSEFDIHYPQAAVENRVQAPVVLELDVSEDGAVLGGRLKSAPRGHQLDAAAAGATSLLVYSPLRLCGCPAEHVSVYTINYRIQQR